MKLLPLLMIASASRSRKLTVRDDMGFGIRLAVRVSNLMGSLAFLVGQATVMTLWVAVNELGIWVFDPYPYILLNLAMSAEAAFTAPLLLMSSRLEGEQGRKTATDDLATDRAVLARVRQIADHLKVPE